MFKRFTLYEGSFDTPGQLSSLGEPRSLKKVTKVLFISLPQYFTRFYVVLEQSPTDSSTYDLNIIPCEEGTKLKTLKLVKFTTKDWNPY